MMTWFAVSISYKKDSFFFLKKNVYSAIQSERHENMATWYRGQKGETIIQRLKEK